MHEEQLVEIRKYALYQAWDTNKNRFNVEAKPTPEELIEAARKFETYLLNG